jgi:sugar phosphate isomerase/epimerase
MKWELGLSTGIGYTQPIEEVLAPIAHAGFRVVEVSTAPHHLRVDDLGQVEVVAGLIRDAGLHVHSLHAPFGHDVNFTSPEPEQRRHALRRLTDAAEALRILGGTQYVIHPGGEDQRWTWDRDHRMALSVEGLTQVWGECRRRGLTLVVETPLPHLLGGRLEDLEWILARLPPEGTGVCVDTSHTSLGGFLLEAIERFGRRIVHVQASDTRGVTDDHLPPGDGIIDWPRLVGALEGVGYQGVFMLEVSGDGQVADRITRSAAWAPDGALGAPPEGRGA